MKKPDACYSLVNLMDDLRKEHLEKDKCEVRFCGNKGVRERKLSYGKAVLCDECFQNITDFSKKLTGYDL